MAQKGDSFEIVLQEAHADWGEHRYTNSRARRDGEGYIRIPREYAVKYCLYNENGTGRKDVLGKNIFNCVSVDGIFRGMLKSQGNSGNGDIYAKQFAGNNDLRAVGTWYREMKAEIGDVVKVVFVSPTDIEIELIRK